MVNIHEGTAVLKVLEHEELSCAQLKEETKTVRQEPLQAESARSRAEKRHAVAEEHMVARQRKMWESSGRRG